MIDHSSETKRFMTLKKFVLLGYFIKHKALYFWRVHNHTVWFQTRLGKNLLQSVVYIYTIIRAYFEGHQNRHLYQKNVQWYTLIFGKQIKLPNQFGNIHADSTFIIDLRSNFGSTMTKLCKTKLWGSHRHFFTFRLQKCRCTLWKNLNFFLGELHEVIIRQSRRHSQTYLII